MLPIPDEILKSFDAVMEKINSGAGPAGLPEMATILSRLPCKIFTARFKV